MLVESATAAPPDGAAWLRPTWHWPLAPDAGLEGSHTSEDTVTVGLMVTVAVLEAPL